MGCRRLRVARLRSRARMAGWRHLSEGARVHPSLCHRCRGALEAGGAVVLHDRARGMALLFLRGAGDGRRRDADRTRRSRRRRSARGTSPQLHWIAGAAVRTVADRDSGQHALLVARPLGRAARSARDPTTPATASRPMSGLRTHPRPRRRARRRAMHRVRLEFGRSEPMRRRATTRTASVLPGSLMMSVPAPRRRLRTECQACSLASPRTSDTLRDGRVATPFATALQRMEFAGFGPDPSVRAARDSREVGEA